MSCTFAKLGGIRTEKKRNFQCRYFPYYLPYIFQTDGKHFFNSLSLPYCLENPTKVYFLFQSTNIQLCMSTKDICCSSDTKIYIRPLPLCFPKENFSIYSGFECNGPKSQKGVSAMTVKTWASTVFYCHRQSLFSVCASSGNHSDKLSSDFTCPQTAEMLHVSHIKKDGDHTVSLNLRKHSCRHSLNRNLNFHYL